MQRWLYSVHTVFIVLCLFSLGILYGKQFTFFFVKEAVLAQWQRVFVEKRQRGSVEQKQTAQDFDRLYQEHIQLEKDIQELKQALGEKKLVVLENQHLKALLELKQTLPYRSHIAKVLYQVSPKERPSFSLAKGYEEGVRHLMPVVFHQEEQLILIGRIKTVLPHFSYIETLASQDYEVLVYIEDTEVIGVLRGSKVFSDYLLVDYIAQQYEGIIQTGQRVFTLGNSFMPRQLLIGEVESTVHSGNPLYFGLNVRPIAFKEPLIYVFLLEGQ